MRTRQDHLYGRKDIYPKQQKTQGKDSTGKSWLCRCRPSKTTKDDEIVEVKLLVAKT